MHTCARLAPLLSFAALVACSPPKPPEPSAPTGSASTTSLPDAAPPASADGAGTSTASGRRNDPAVINFSGFGPATFGSDEEHVRMAWGYPLESGASAPGSTCRYLDMDPQPENGHGIRFMMEEGKFARYDVDVPLHAAPGDIVVGDHVA